MKLHIGCGEKYLQGYKHVDILDMPHIDYVTNAGDLSFLESGCIEEIYACHVLEHFKRQEIDAVLTEWSRVLRRGGVLRISVPDFEAISAEYAQNRNIEPILGLLYGGQNHDYNFHFQAYDFKRLQGMLEKCGLVDMRRYNWRDFLPISYDDYSRAYLPHMDFDNGRLMSLNVIAVKE